MARRCRLDLIPSTCSVQFRCSVMSDSLEAHGLQHARLSCPSPIPRAYSNSCPLSWWCHPTISSSVVPFSSCLSQHQGLFQCQSFTSGGQSIGASASASLLPMNIQGWFPLALTGLICSSRDSQNSSPALEFESNNFWELSLLYGRALLSVHDSRKNPKFDYF